MTEAVETLASPARNIPHSLPAQTLGFSTLKVRQGSHLLASFEEEQSAVQVLAWVFGKLTYI